MVITSKDNELIKHIKKLKEKKYREEYNEFLIEGLKLVEEAISENVNIKNIIISEKLENQNLISNKILDKENCVFVNEKVFKNITDVINPQGIMAIVEKGSEYNNKIDYNENLFLLLENVQDPGNIGTILRTADSLKMKQIIVSKGSADCYNLKVVRSTMGAIFRVNVIEVDNIESTIKELKNHGINIYVTDLKTDKSIYDVDYEKTAIVIGNESNGVSRKILDLADKRIKIPMLGKTESLNAAVATSIILYEANRKNGAF